MSLDSRLPSLARPMSPPSGWRVLVACTEGRLLAVGLMLCLALAVSIGIGLFVAPQPTMKLGTVVGLSLVIGIAAGISYGYAAGLGAFEVIACNVFVESLQVLVLYPLFLLVWQQLIDVGRIAPVIERLRSAAQARQGAVRRWGIAGLFLFVFIPFWMTGPVVGAIIGFLLGFGPALNLAVVLSASALGVVVYAVFLEQLSAWASAIHPYAVFAVIVALAAGVWIVQRWTRRPPTAAPDPGGLGNRHSA